jgi:hypothetical protein
MLVWGVKGLLQLRLGLGVGAFLEVPDLPFSHVNGNSDICTP